MPLPLKREAPRQVVHWEGEFTLEGERLALWRRCRLLAVSTSGSGLELLDVTPEEAIGKEITLAVKLRGTVQRASMTPKRLVRVGLQFVELTPTERMYLESLGEKQMHLSVAMRKSPLVAS